MQVPERLALIGGSILLSSTLIFSLKGQAAQIIPKVGHSISNIYDHVGDAKNDSEFGNGYQEAQQKGWTTGQWGSAKYYIDDQHNLYVSQGELQGSLTNIIGNDLSNSIQTVNFTQHVTPPVNSSGLLASLHQVNYINGLNNFDVSNVHDMTWIFHDDPNLKTLDIGKWDMSMDAQLGEMFNGDYNLRSINITSFKTAWIIGGMFDDTGLEQVTVGKDTNLWGGQGLQNRGKWKAPSGFIGDFPGGGDNAGTWIKQ